MLQIGSKKVAHGSLFAAICNAFAAYLMPSCYRLVLNGQCIAMKAMAGQGGSWQAKAGHARLIKPADCLFAELAGGQLCG